MKNLTIRAIALLSLILPLFPVGNEICISAELATGTVTESNFVDSHIVESKLLSQSCPLCPAIGAQTIAEQIDQMDAVVIASLAKNETMGKVSKCTFQIETILKGDSFIKKDLEIKFPYKTKRALGSRFLLSSIPQKELDWDLPKPLSESAEKYVLSVKKLDIDADPITRLSFYQDYLESEDEVIAQDAYDEFARAPYDQILMMKDKYKLNKIIGWAKSDAVPSSRRRLYFMLLGVCGSKKQIPMLEKIMRSVKEDEFASIDSVIACYLSLAGEDGMDLIDELFVANKESRFSDTYSAVQALRFHGTDANTIPRKRIIESFHYLLERPQLADLIIPDLARWEDWTVMDSLVELFKKSDGKNSFVRIPIFQFLRTCPLEEAEQHYAALEKIDPQSAKRASFLFQLGDGFEIED